MADTRPLTELMLSEHEPHWIVPDREHLPGRFGGFAWGLLLLWVGVAIVANVGSGVGFVVAGVIILGAEAVRTLLIKLRVEGFAAFLGVVFLLGGILNLVTGQVDIVPITFWVAGATVIVGALTSKPGRSG